jgi:hypothetical protein
MDSPIRIKTLAQWLALLSAGLLLQSNTLFAAEIAADAQRQAQDLLTGTVNGRPRTVDQSPAISSDGAQPSIVDAQEQARRLLLGQPTGGDTAIKRAAIASTTEKARPESHHGQVYSDPQESARRMILGVGASGRATSALRGSVSLTQAPLVMRLNKDEFRMVSYAAPPGAARTIAVDHQYFDTAEGEHTTEIVKVSVDRMSCVDAPRSQPELSATRTVTARKPAREAQY